MDSSSFASRSKLNTEKYKREPLPIIGNGSNKPSFKKKHKRKRIIGSVPIVKTESESETDISSAYSKYIPNVLACKASAVHTFVVYEENTGCSFKIGRSSFKYNNKHVFVDGKMYKATQGVWELLTQSRPDKNVVTHHDRQAYKQIFLQSSASKL